MILKLIALFIWLIWIPLGMGLFSTCIHRGKAFSPAKDGMHSFAEGYVFMWAVFQLITVPMVLKSWDFKRVEITFEVVSLTLAIAGTLLCLLRIKAGGKGNEADQTNTFDIRNKISNKMHSIFSRENTASVVLWGIFVVSLLFQLAQSFRLAYADGDDAYYIPLSTAANLGGRMYELDSYTGVPTTLDMRHGLAPFPMWISFIVAKVGVNVAVAAHTWIPLVLIPLTYVIYLEIGRLLVGGVGNSLKNGNQALGKERTAHEGAGGVNPMWKLPLFMVFISLLQIFGNYSIYPASTFLLTRARQGKEALGNIIIPFTFLLLLRIAKEVEENADLAVPRGYLRHIFAFMCISFAGCLCSTMSGFLIPMLLLMGLGLVALLHRKWGLLLEGFVGCIPAFTYAILFVILK